MTLLMTILGVLGLVVGALSLTWQVHLAVHIAVLMLCGLPLWGLSIQLRPFIPCRCCEKGLSWDAAHWHFGTYCPGVFLGLWSCGGTGRKLRWEWKLLRLLGLGSHLRDPVGHDP